MTPVVMLVDDTPANLKLLDAVLRTQGCDVRSFTAGPHALDVAAREPPDLVLLDIAMPEMDGFEVCRRLKALPGVAKVPIIFLTATNAPQDRLQAFQCGGVDYVTKPFQVEELWARVSAHLQLRALTSELERHNRELDQVVAERNAELADAHRRLGLLDRAKNDFFRLMSHELRTPLNGLFGIGDLLIDECPRGSATDELATMFRVSRDRIMNVLENTEVLTRIEVASRHFARELLALEPLLVATARSLPEADAPRVEVKGGSPDNPLVTGDLGLFRHSFRAMIKTALRFARLDAVVCVRWAKAPGGVTVSVEAEGTRVPEDLLPSFFDVMGAARAMASGHELSLDPAVAQRVFGLFDARLTVENTTPAGVRLAVVLPLAE